MEPNALTPKQQTSEAIRQAQNVLITTSQHPTTDQIAATIALAGILRKLGKKVSATISDQVPAPLNFLPVETLDKTLGGTRDFIIKLDLSKVEAESLKYTRENGHLNIHLTPSKGSFVPSDVSYDYGAYHFDIAIVLGVPTRARLDRVYQQHPELLDQVPIINLDFHRSNELYGAINMIDVNAASLSEMLVALSESLQAGLIDDRLATTLLTGIIASTDRFTAIHTTPKALTVAAQMMAIGAKQQTIVRALYRSGASDQSSTRPARERITRDDNTDAPGTSVPPTISPQSTPPATTQPTTPVEATPTESDSTLDTPDTSTSVVDSFQAPSWPGQLTVLAAAQSNEPNLYFKGQGSVLANLPDTAFTNEFIEI